MNITGRIHEIGQMQAIPTKKGTTITKRDIVLDTTRFDTYTGQRSEYENYPLLEFSGDKCKDLDGFKVGDVVTVFFELQGGYFDSQDGTKKNFTKVRGYKIEARKSIQPQQNVQPQAVQPQAASQYAPQYQQPTPPPPGMDDLPFPL